MRFQNRLEQLEAAAEVSEDSPGCEECRRTPITLCGPDETPAPCPKCGRVPVVVDITFDERG